MRDYSLMDKILLEVDTALRTILVPKHRATTRPSPSKGMPPIELTEVERRHVAGLMRVNHAGEVCAQALYQGQALTAELTRVKEQMTEAALEEQDHLAWCEERLQALNSHVSVLNPFWYIGSLFLGSVAGWCGDKWSLGFVAETERQVCAHLQEHLKEVPKQDQHTLAIISRMEQDESEHAKMASDAGAAPLPFFIKWLMKWTAKCLTVGSYYI